jgi:hypothetical protein
LSEVPIPARNWLTMVGPPEISAEEETERITVEVSVADADFISRYAALRNALAEAEDRRLRKKWTRKMMAESMLAAQCDAARQQMQDMFKALGDLPDAEDKAACLTYAKKALAWAKKNIK